MATRPRLLWDSSALIDAVFALADTPYRDLFDLGEAGAIDMRVSPDVVRECDAVLRTGPRGSDKAGQLALALNAANFAVTPPPDDATVDYCEQLTGYRSDARILAAAEECRADILVTHDRQHFLGNPLVSPPDTHCRARTAQEALDWCLRRLLGSQAPDTPG